MCPVCRLLQQAAAVCKPELLMMGIVLPETCWACNKICNKYHLLNLVGTLFPHNNDDARSKSLQMNNLYVYVNFIKSLKVTFVVPNVFFYFTLRCISDSYSVARQCYWPNLGHGSKKVKKHWTNRTAWVTKLQTEHPTCLPPFSPEYFVCHVNSSLKLQKEYTSVTAREYGAQVNI